MPSDTHDDIRDLLLGVTSDLPALAPAPGRTVRRARRRMIGTVSLLAVLAGLVVGGTLSVIDPFSRTQPVSTPHMKSGAWVVDTKTGAATRLEGLPRDAFWFAASRDGSMVAFAGNSHGTTQIYLMEPDGTRIHQVTHDPLEASHPALSADASMLAYEGFGGGQVRNIFVMDLTTHHVEQVTHERRDVSEMDWSPDGARILYSVPIPGIRSGPATNRSASSVLKIADVQTHAVERVAGARRFTADFGTWSPNGAKIAFMSGSEGANETYGFEPTEIWVMNDDGTEPQKVLSFDGRSLSLKWSPTGSEIAYALLDGDTLDTYAVDVDTHAVHRIAPGGITAWIDDRTVIVEI